MGKSKKISVITSLYRSSKYLDSYFKNILEISNLNDVELVIVHNEPTNEEKKTIKKYANIIPNIKYKIVSRESIYASWNKAIKLSSGQYLAMWSVDDRRITDSLSTQSQFLDDNPETMIVTGNYLKVFNYGDTDGYLKRDLAKKTLLNGIPKFNNGCFLMWRKSVHDHVGYFDEQFKVGGDQEFWVRVSREYPVKSCNSLLGYFLRINNVGLSKEKNNAIRVEREIINIRYYNFFVINIFKYLIYKNIKIDKVKSNEVFTPLNIECRYKYIKILPSIFLFWVPFVKKIMIKYLYKIREKKIINKENII